MSDRFAGAWRLLSAEYQRQGQTVGYPFGPHPVGLLMYDGANHMSAQIMQPNRAALADSRAKQRAVVEGRAAFDGYLGYYGTYELQPDGRTIIHHLIGSSLPHWVGTEQVRRYEFAADRLTLSAQATTDDAGAVAVLVWERIRPCRPDGQGEDPAQIS